MFLNILEEIVVKKIYLLLMQTNTIPSKIIKMLTHYEYSHAAISLDERCDTLYSFGRTNPKTIINSGFSIEHKNGEFFKIFDQTNCIIYEISTTDEKYQQLIKLLDYMAQNSTKYKYDYLGIVLRFLKIPITFKNRYVCSYFVADILNRTNIYKFDRSYFTKPKDFSDIKEFKPIYQGK